MLGRISICLRKHDPSAFIIIYILFVQTLQLHWQSVLYVLLTAKFESHTLHFERETADIYYTAVGLEKM